MTTASIGYDGAIATNCFNTSAEASSTQCQSSSSRTSGCLLVCDIKMADSASIIARRRSSPFICFGTANAVVVIERRCR